MRRREPRPLLIRREELAHLVLLCAGVRIAAAEQAPDELEQPDVAGGDLVVAALAVQREYLHRPAADAGDRAQPAPAVLVLGAVQVDAPEGYLACGVHERQRARARQVEGLQQRRRGTG